MTRAMKAANKPQYAVIMLLGFLCLATYSYGQRNTDYASRAEFGALLDKSMGGVSTRKDEAAKALESPPAKPVLLWSEKQIGDAKIFAALMEAENE
jgi:hypothetical protein